MGLQLYANLVSQPSRSGKGMQILGACKLVTQRIAIETPHLMFRYVNVVM